MPKNVDIPVVIKPTAYYKMLLHVLRFGSKVKDPNQCKEVMGGLIGHIEKKEEKEILIIEDAIPVSHGGAIEVRYSPEQLGDFAEIDNRVFEEHGEQGWFSCGWYHSHPGLSPFFSGTDIMNQLFWQAKNPAGVGLVFDHVYLDNPGDLGFKAFRLDDPSKSRNTSYHEVPATVEPPDEVSYYNKIIDLVDGVYTKQIPIMELNETTNFFEDVFIPTKESLMIKKPELDVNQLINSLKTGMGNFLELSLTPLIVLLNSWSQETLKKTFFNNSQMRQDLEDLKTSLTSGMMDIQKSFNYSLHDELEKLDIFIDDRLDVLEEKQEKVGDFIKEFKEKMITLTQSTFEQSQTPILTENFKALENLTSNLDIMNKKNVSVIKDLEKSNVLLQEASKILEPSKIRIVGSLEERYEKISDNAKKKLKNTEKNFENLEKDSKKLLADLKAAILVLEGSKEPILNKIERLEVDKKNLLEKIKELKTTNEDLLKKVKTLEEGGVK
jgi:proteasome lid subunit RPN8/RPN11